MRPSIDDELEQSLQGGVLAKMYGCVRLWFLTQFEEVIGGLYTRRYKVHATTTDAKTNLVHAQARLQDAVGQGQFALEEQKARLQHALGNGQILIAEQKVHLQHLLSPTSAAPARIPSSHAPPAASPSPPVMVDVSDEKIEKVALTTLLGLGPARDADAEARLFLALNALYKQYPTYVAKEIATRTMQLWEDSRASGY